jgi:curved DNA-binding protein CbpA
MSFQIERGLFKLDFIDHHAILGISVDADVKEVRKRYLKIARRLHPDSCKAESEDEKKLANQLLSKLVNPAYEELSQSNREYEAKLRYMGKRLSGEAGKFTLPAQAAKQLSQAGANLDIVYKTAVQNIASNEYESLSQVLEKIAELSELNMVYLTLKEGRGEGIKPGGARPGTGTGTTGSRPGAGTGPTGSRPGTGTSMPGASVGSSGTLPDSQGGSRVGEYIRRAEGYMAKGNFAGAVLELREALKLDQNNSNSHTLLGLAYLKQNQATMAKVHLNKALQLNPKDERALKGKQYLDKLAQKNTGSTGSTKPAEVPSKPPESKPPGKPSSGGLFGGFFGGKKK